MKLRRAPLEEGGRALLLVVGRRAQTEVRGFQEQPFALACLRAFVCRLERELDRDGRVRSDLVQDRFCAGDQFSRGNDLVDEPDAIGLLRADRLSGQDELQRATFADETWEALRSPAARNESERDFGLAEL